MNQSERIQVDDAPAPKGAYSQVVRAGDLLFVSGQGAIDPDTQEFVFGDIRSETKLTLENVERVLIGCGATRKNIVKCGVFLAKAEDFDAMNEVYGAFFFEGAPARTTVQATLVEPGMKVEIDCVAYLPQKSETR
ncbi:MAG TPA: RidA family protein [Bryocella sp.]|nr:RidA family protein [Bryocella sp.]